MMIYIHLGFAKVLLGWIRRPDDDRETFIEVFLMLCHVPRTDSRACDAQKSMLAVLCSLYMKSGVGEAIWDLVQAHTISKRLLGFYLKPCSFRAQMPRQSRLGNRPPKPRFTLPHPCRQCLLTRHIEMLCPALGMVIVRKPSYVSLSNNWETSGFSLQK